MQAGRCQRERDGRIVRAAQYWLAGHPDYVGHDIFDVVLAAPWAWPRYIENAFPI